LFGYIRLLIAVLKLAGCAVLRLCLSDGLSLCPFCQSDEWAWLIMCDVNKLEFVFAATITS